MIDLLNVSNPHKNSRILFRGDHFLKAGDTHLSSEVHSRIQEFKPSSFLTVRVTTCRLTGIDRATCTMCRISSV